MGSGCRYWWEQAEIACINLHVVAYLMSTRSNIIS